MQSIVPLLGRMLLAAIFLMAGYNKLAGFEGTIQYMASNGIPMAKIAIFAVIAVELGGGLSVLLGYKARCGAWLLFLFLIPTTIVFHTNFADQMQMIMFLKNLAIMGGMLLLAAYGPGKWSLDARGKACCGTC